MPSNSAPRGTAIVSPAALTDASPAGDRAQLGQRARAALLAGERDVQASRLQREADRRQAAPEAAEQLVVAPAAADRRAERGVVDLEYGARVVADVAHQPEIEDHARGDARLEQLVHSAHAGDSLGGRLRRVRQHLRAAAALGHARAAARPLRRETPGSSSRCSSATKSRRTSASSSAGAELLGATPRLAISAGNSEASPRPIR